MAPDSVGLLQTARLARLPALSVRPIHDGDGFLDSIQVLRGGRVVQTLIPVADVDPAPEPGKDVDTVDIDMDGDADIQRQTVWGATGNAAFEFWLFDADSGRFVAAPEYGEKIAGYQLDRAKREIVVRSNGGHAGAIFEMDVYRPEGRHLVRLRSVHQDWKPDVDRYLRTTGQLEGDGWVERVDTFTAEALPSPDSL